MRLFQEKRRRWGPSTTANVWEMIKNQAEARKNNSYISMPYVIYHFAMLIFSLIGVSTTIMMVAEALFISLGYNIGECIFDDNCRIPTVKLKIPGKTFLKSESRTSVTFKL